MSMMPDTRQAAEISLPGNAQVALRSALVTLHTAKPDLFAGAPRTLSSLWDVGVALNAQGGEYLANLIVQALDAEKDR